MILNDIWKEKESGKLIELSLHSGDDYLYFDEKLVKEKKYEIFPINFTQDKNIVEIMKSETFGDRSYLYILDENTFRIHNKTYERSEDVEHILDRHANQGWDEISRKLFP